LCSVGQRGGIQLRVASWVARKSHLGEWSKSRSRKGGSHDPIIIIVGSLRPDEIWHFYGLRVTRHPW